MTSRAIDGVQCFTACHLCRVARGTLLSWNQAARASAAALSADLRDTHVTEYCRDCYSLPELQLSLQSQRKILLNAPALLSAGAFSIFPETSRLKRTVVILERMLGSKKANQ